MGMPPRGRFDTFVALHDGYRFEVLVHGPEFPSDAVELKRERNEAHARFFLRYLSARDGEPTLTSGRACLLFPSVSDRS